MIFCVVDGCCRIKTYWGKNKWNTFVMQLDLNTLILEQSGNIEMDI